MKKLTYRWEYSDYLNPDFVNEIDKNSVSTILELGCHDGADTIMLHETYGATIHAFECHPGLMEQARKRCAGLHNIHLVQKAVWDQDGLIPFYPVVRTTEKGKTIENPGASSCFRARTDYHRTYEQTQIMVESMRIDTYCKKHDLPQVDMLCMDVQGAALHALSGCGDILLDVRYIIVEIEHRPIYHDQDLFPEVNRYLTGYDFKPVAEVTRDAWFNDYLYIKNNR